MMVQHICTHNAQVHQWQCRNCFTVILKATMAAAKALICLQVLNHSGMIE